MNILRGDVIVCGFRTIGREWVHAHVRSSYWRMYIHNCAGAGVICGDQVYRIPPRRVFFVPAWCRFTCCNDQPVTQFCVHFNLLGLNRSLTRQFFPTPLHLDEKADFDQAAGWFGDTAVDAVTRGLHVTACLNQHLAALIERLPTRRGEGLAAMLAGRSPWAEVLDYVDENIAGALSNRDLADVCHLSESHFIRKFTAAVGQAPAHYVRERRVARAAEALAFSDRSIDAIAAEAGFANRFHFSRVFGELMGMPPAQYRRTTRGQAV